MKKILLYGGCSYGAGGASKNISRLMGYINEHKPEYDCEAYHNNICANPEKCDRRVTGFNVFKLLRENGYDLIMVYSLISWRLQLSVAFASIISPLKIIFSIRNDRFKENYAGLRWFEKLVFRFFISRVDRIVGVVKDTDYLFLNKRKLAIIPGYIEPAKDEYDSALPSEIENFIRSHRTIIVSNASKLWKHKGLDLYGVDMAISLLSCLQQAGKEGVGVIFVVARIDNNHKSYMAELENQISNLALDNNFLLWKESIPFTALLKRSDLSLRLTTTDGDAVSLRESLFLGTPVIASDVALRPEGAVIFRSRDLPDLVEKTLMVLERPRVERSSNVNSSVNENAVRLIDLWETVLQ